MQNKTTGEQNSCLLHERNAKWHPSVGSCGVFIQKPKNLLAQYWDNKHYETFVSPNAQVQVESVFFLDLFTKWDIKCIFFGWKTFSLLVSLMSEMSLLPPTVPCVSSRCTSVFQCAVETLCGAATLLSLCQSDPHEYKNWHTQSLCRTDGSQLSDWCRVVWLFVSVLHGFVLLASVCQLLRRSKSMNKQMHHNSVSSLCQSSCKSYTLSNTHTNDPLPCYLPTRKLLCNPPFVAHNSCDRKRRTVWTKM